MGCLIAKNLYISRVVDREAVLFCPKSGTSRPEKRYFFPREVALCLSTGAIRLIIKRLMKTSERLRKIFTK